MTAEISLANQIRAFARYAHGLPRYLRDSLTLEAAQAQIRRDLASREGSFLAVLREGVYAASASPYRRLLDHAGIGLSDIETLVRAHGIEETLDTLYDAGVRLSLDEFKGRSPIRRGSLTFAAETHDFDNPLVFGELRTMSGGSRTGTRIYADLDLYAQEASYEYVFQDAMGLVGRPYGIWRPVPPHGAGIGAALRSARIGKGLDRWFSQSRLRPGRRTWRHDVLTLWTLVLSRLAGRPIVWPEHVPLDEAWRVAEWLAACKAAGRPAWLNSNAASAVRVGMAALDRGIDIAGSVVRTGGEPLTEAKAKILRDAGCETSCYYTMGESGRLGIGCADRHTVDDVHVLIDKAAIIQRETSVGSGCVQANIVTTFSRTTPKIMLNVDCGDYGVLERRRCGCTIGALGYDLHLHTIRSHEKLTSEGMNFLGHDLIRLVEEVLPARFGGRPTDWQMVEEEESGLPRVSLVASPRIGELDEDATVDAVVAFLNQVPGSSGDYGERWRDGHTLRIVRREPFATMGSKVQALHTFSGDR